MAKQSIRSLLRLLITCIHDFRHEIDSKYLLHRDSQKSVDNSSETSKMPEYHTCYVTSNQAILPRITMRFLRISTLIACSSAKTKKSLQIGSGRSSNFRVSRTRDEFHSIYVTNGMDYRTSTDLRTDQRAINHVQIPKSNSL